MNNTNLPTIQNRRNRILNIAKKYINRLSSKATNSKIIDEFKYIKQYNVLSMPAFKVTVDRMINNSPEGTIIMADINDLYVANKYRGKEKVNEMINSMINTIKNTLNDNNAPNHKIGKMGDEIYIYVPDKGDIDTDNIISKLQSIRVNELSLSAGASSNFSKGLTNAINEADKQMTVNKSEFKTKRLKKICGDNLEKIVENVVETQLEKMRINLEQLKNSNKPDLRNTFDKAIEQLNINKITSNDYNDNTYNVPKEIDSFEELKSQYTNKAKLLYGDNKQLIHDYVLASMLSKHPVEGVINSDFFQGMEYKKVFKRIKKDKKNKEFDLIAMDLSGLKTINDTLGHEEGDKAIFETIEHFKSTLNSENITMYSEIIAKVGGNSYALVEKMSEDMKSKVFNKLQEYGTSENSKYNMSILCSVQTIDKRDIAKSGFKNIVNQGLSKAEENLEHESFNRKLKDVDAIKNSIQKIYHQVINMDNIQLLLKNNTETKDKVFEMIKRGFENCIEAQKSDSNINLSKNSIVLQKSKALDEKSVNINKKLQSDEISI